MASRHKTKNKKQIKRSTPAPQPAGRKSVETRQTMRAAPDVSHLASTEGDEIIQPNVGIVDQALQSGAIAAERVTEEPDQHPPSKNIPEEEAIETIQESPTQSRTAMTDMTSRLIRGWFDFARARYERNFAGITTLMRCRTPQDFVALQYALMRVNVESFLAYGRRPGEHRPGEQ